MAACAAAVTAVFILLPFHATLTVFLAQFVGHYTVLRLWKEFLLFFLMLGAVYICISSPEIRRRVLTSKLTWLIFAYLGVLLVWGIIAWATKSVTLEALGYGWVVDARFLLFFMAVWIIAQSSPQPGQIWPWLLFIPAAIVVLVGLLQYFVLPYDVMKYLGYSAATIFPYEDINHNTAYIRVMSTLRGANPLGAYLLLVIVLLVAWLAKHVRTWGSWLKLLISVYAVLAVVVFTLTFSRGAWIGLAVSLAAAAWLLRNRVSRRVIAVAAGACGVLVLSLLVLVFVARNPAAQNIVLHTEDNTTIATTSNEGHASALQTGVSQVIREPFGRGPGSAGPASVYNSGHPARIAENYFIQIGQETGWAGLVLFIAVLIALGVQLYVRQNNTISFGLLAALAGLTVVGLTSHVWTDDTLAYVFWGLAGLACAQPVVKHAHTVN